MTTEPDTDDDNPLDALLEDAEEHREQYSEAQQRLSEIKDRLYGLVDDLYAEDAIGSDEHERLQRQIARGDYGRVREAIEDARRAHRLEFDDEEKDVFAARFAESFGELEAAVEQIRTEIVALGEGVDRGDMVAFLYGKHSDLRKRDIEAVFDAIDTVDRTGLSTKGMARALAAFDRDLNISDAEAVIEKIEAEADR